MPDLLLEEAFPERAPIEFLVSYLKTCSELNVKELIGRRLATGVFHGDSDAVAYWAAVHNAYRGITLESDLRKEILECLRRSLG